MIKLNRLNLALKQNALLLEVFQTLSRFTAALRASK